MSPTTMQPLCLPSPAAGERESQPITRPGHCRGQQHSATLIARLQPGRRAGTKVEGTH